MSEAVELWNYASMDDLVGNADVFPVLGRRLYFNHAGIAPMPRPVGEAVREFLCQFENDAFLGFDFDAPVQTLRKQFAAWIGAGEDEIALLHNTSEAVSAIALGIDWQPGDRVILSDSEYPANQYPWMAVRDRFGVELVIVREETDDGGRVCVPDARLLEEIAHPNTRLLALSHVQWGTGQGHDLEKFGKACREHDVLFSVDAIQSLGVMPIDVEAAQIDFLQAGGHKWMLGTMGAACLYVRRSRLQQMRLSTVGWNSVTNPMQWEDINFTLQPDARRFEYGSPAVASIIAVGTGMTLLNRLGSNAIAARVQQLGRQFINGIEQLGCAVVSPHNDDNRGGAVCFLPPDRSAESAKSLYQELSKNQSCELASRCGRVRFSPHFYNTNEQVDRCVELIGNAIA